MPTGVATRVAVVSGGSSGIGHAIASRLVQEGAKVASLDLLPPPALSRFLHVAGDVASGPDVRRFYETVTSSLGKPDIVVSNAGSWLQEKLVEGDPEKWARLLNVNVLGALRLIRAFVPHMVEQKNGDVIIISSVAANQPHAYGGVYAATKSALDVIAETLRIETLPHVRVTVIAPGVVDTAFFQSAPGGPAKAEELGVGSLRAAEVADAVLFALQRPSGSSVNRITLRPTSQEF